MRCGSSTLFTFSKDRILRVDTEKNIASEKKMLKNGAKFRIKSTFFHLSLLTKA